MASLASVTYEQFEIISEVELIHIPTGVYFRAYPYSDPEDMLQSIEVNWGRASPLASDYAEQVRRVASELLLERTHQEYRGRRFFGNAA
jgi:hypothetical protein